MNPNSKQALFVAHVRERQAGPQKSIRSLATASKKRTAAAPAAVATPHAATAQAAPAAATKTNAATVPTPTKKRPGKSA